MRHVALVKTELDSMPAEMDELNRKIMQMEIEEAALKKEDDRLSKERLEELQKRTCRDARRLQSKKRQDGRMRKLPLRKYPN